MQTLIYNLMVVIISIYIANHLLSLAITNNDRWFVRTI